MLFQRFPILSSSLVALVAAAAVQAPGSAWADDPRQAPPPPPPYMVQPAQQPLYTAPLSQTTQTTYVPQSVAMSGPEEISDYDENRAVPAGYTPVARTRKGLIISGAVTFGATYSVAVLAAAAGQDSGYEGENQEAAMWIPVAGPFIQMAKTSTATGKVFLFGMGAAETAGAIMLFYGLSSPQHVLVRNDLLGMSVTPMVSPGATGMMVSGKF
jgi:hypothetical protein